MQKAGHCECPAEG